MEPTEADLAKADDLVREIIIGGTPWLYKKATVDRIARALAAAREEGRGTFKVLDDGPCYYCGEPTDSWAGNPDRWPLRFCHSDEPGKSKYHHIGCVTSRLNTAEAARKAPQ